VSLTRPLDPLDTACLAATRAPWHSFAPTWKLDLRGAIDVSHLQQALDRVLPTYPWLAATIRDGAWHVPASPKLLLTSTTSEDAVLDRFLDVEREPVFEAVLQPKGPDAATLLFHQHHVLADGRAFLGFIGDFFQTLARVERGEAPSASSVVVRRAHVDVVQTTGLARLLDSLRGSLHALRELARAVLRPVQPLRCNLGTNFESGHRTLHLEVPLVLLDRWKAIRPTHGLSTNDLLTGALLRALTPWAPAPDSEHTVFLPVDARPRSGFDSFANHLTNVQLRWRARAETTALQYARHVHTEAAWRIEARLPWVRVPFDAFVGRVVPLETLRRGLLDDRRLVTNVSFSNLLPLGVPGGVDGRWRTHRLIVERLCITTPCVPPQAVNLTVAQSGPNACFNFNYKPTAIDALEVQQLATRFSTALDELEADLQRT
jgi:hypothetical protein